MTSDIRITLICDPYGICTDADECVRDYPGELRAFRQIEQLLRRDARFETVRPKTYIVEANCWEHFRSYQSVSGVAVREVTPRTRLADRLAVKPLDWLTDGRVLRWQLLDRKPPSGPVEDWAGTLAEWLLPGIAHTESISQWLSLAAATEGFPDRLDCPPIKAWFRDCLKNVAQKSGLAREISESLLTDLDESDSPVAFASVWLRRRSLLPLVDFSARNPLRVPGVNIGSTRERVVAGRLPLVFPLPDSLHVDICLSMRRAVHNARVQYPEAFEEAVLRLNALWDGVAEELGTWLEMRPRGMTRKAADHLRKLPGVEKCELARRLLENYCPPDAVPAWVGLEEGPVFDAWATAYARFARNCFIRRDLPEASNDPAAGFGRWLKDHDTVSFAHPDRGYGVIARRVRKSLAAGQSVILILIDALAVHVASDLAAYLTDQLGAEPTWCSHLFAPVPTITSVCKAAVLTGGMPNAAGGELHASLSRAYALNIHDIQLASSWEDAERLTIRPGTRLLVHRDNRLDDRLHKTGSFHALLDECCGIFSRVAALAARWVGDFRCVNRVPPVVMVTADHGFTYGPPPARQTHAGRKVPPTHRCVEIQGEPFADEFADESLTVLESQRFYNTKTFLAARGRYFGSDTTSGWTLSHGGLLPEEVIIPVVEWFGQEDAVSWPVVLFPEGAEFDRAHWILPVLLRNPHARSLPSGSFTIGISGMGACQHVSVPPLAIGGEHRCEFRLSGEGIPEGEKISVEVEMKIHSSRNHGESTRADQYLVDRAKRLIERTAEQDDFEAMF